MFTSFFRLVVAATLVVVALSFTPQAPGTTTDPGTGRYYSPPDDFVDVEWEKVVPGSYQARVENVYGNAPPSRRKPVSEHMSNFFVDVEYEYGGQGPAWTPSAAHTASEQTPGSQKWRGAAPGSSVREPKKVSLWPKAPNAEPHPDPTASTASAPRSNVSGGSSTSRGSTQAQAGYGIPGPRWSSAAHPRPEEIRSRHQWSGTAAGASARTPKKVSVWPFTSGATPGPDTRASTAQAAHPNASVGSPRSSFVGSSQGQPGNVNPARHWSGATPAAAQHVSGPRPSPHEHNYNGAAPGTSASTPLSGQAGDAEFLTESEKNKEAKKEAKRDGHERGGGGGRERERES